MEPTFPIPAVRRRTACSTRPRGFALVVTISLMVLLSLIAVGLLGLAGISLRSSDRGDARAEARANARLALLMALGDLQKFAGPDQRITARADIDEDHTANPRLTGVWESWEIDATSPPSPSEYEESAREDRFLGWLASGPDRGGAGQIDFPGSEPEDPVVLWGEGSLGAAPQEEDFVTAGRIPVSAGSAGGLAWAVLDEGVKARINTPHDEALASEGGRTMRLGSGVRPATSTMPGLSGLESEFFERDSDGFATMRKGLSRHSLVLAGDELAGGTSEALESLTHDVTPYALGVLADVAGGGLKEDLNLLSERETLPGHYAGEGVYASLLGMNESAAPSDPRWESLHEFARLHRDHERLASADGAPLLKASVPNHWNAARVTGRRTSIREEPPPGAVLLPSLAKVQMLFSLVGRDLYGGLPPVERMRGRRLTPQQKQNGIHGPQDEKFRDTKYDYDLQLLYTPVVTLHNPYNVALEFTDMRVEFVHVPFAMKVYRNGRSQSTDFVPQETMYGDNHSGSQDKIFGMNLKSKARGDRPGSTTVKLMPGEVKMFSPYIDPNRTYRQDLNDRQFWDIFVGSSLTTDIEAIPGWRGDGIGFSADNLAAGYSLGENHEAGRAHDGTLGLAWDDRIHVEFVPRNIDRADNRFMVQMSATLPGSRRPKVVKAIELDFEADDGLEQYLSENGAEMPIRYPARDDNPNYILGQDFLDRATTPVSEMTNVKPFALLSVQGKTTSGGRDSSDDDGRLATKPWAFNHAMAGGSSQKVLSNHQANFSHEIDLQRLEEGTSNLLSVDQHDRSNFISGHTSFNGTKFGAHYEVPLAPAQSLVTLNGANPGGSSGYLPRFARPIGNSWAHPLVDPAQVSTSGGEYPYLDHSFLLNLALWDRFYFSGLESRTGPFGSGDTTEQLAQRFADGEPLADPRLTLRPPAGQSAGEFTELVGEDNASERVAAWQVFEGAFNVNSTSVPAWKAMLGSIQDAGALFNSLDKNDGSSSFADLPETGEEESRVSRFRLPASESDEDGGEIEDAYWLGPREYSDSELETLAENIVEQVRQRGPFLSMAEFVNRRLGPASEETAQRGALQQAIDNAGLNADLANSANAGYEISSGQVQNYQYANPEAGAGPSYQGAPGYLSQADLLAVLGNAATARSDTFTIRGHGEARDAAGAVLASATCEAVVQRVPDYVDPADEAATAPDELTSEANREFGRRFEVVSFRWLSPEEI